MEIVDREKVDLNNWEPNPQMRPIIIPDARGEPRLSERVTEEYKTVAPLIWSALSRLGTLTNLSFYLDTQQMSFRYIVQGSLDGGFIELAEGGKAVVIITSFISTPDRTGIIQLDGKEYVDEFRSLVNSVMGGTPLSD